MAEKELSVIRNHCLVATLKLIFSFFDTRMRVKKWVPRLYNSIPPLTNNKDTSETKHKKCYESVIWGARSKTKNIRMDLMDLLSFICTFFKRNLISYRNSTRWMHVLEDSHNIFDLLFRLGCFMIQIFTNQNRLVIATEIILHWMQS